MSPPPLPAPALAAALAAPPAAAAPRYCPATAAPMPPLPGQLQLVAATISSIPLGTASPRATVLPLIPLYSPNSPSNQGDVTPKIRRLTII
jgi:hypothetical protein